MLKISKLEAGMIIWNNKCEILGIVGSTLPKELYERYCVKLAGNPFDYMLLEAVENVGDDNE